MNLATGLWTLDVQPVDTLTSCWFGTVDLPSLLRDTFPNHRTPLDAYIYTPRTTRTRRYRTGLIPAVPPPTGRRGDAQVGGMQHYHHLPPQLTRHCLIPHPHRTELPSPAVAPHTAGTTYGFLPRLSPPGRFRTTVVGLFHTTTPHHITTGTPAAGPTFHRTAVCTSVSLHHTYHPLPFNTLFALLHPACRYPATKTRSNAFRFGLLFHYCLTAVGTSSIPAIPHTPAVGSHPAIGPRTEHLHPPPAPHMTRQPQGVVRVPADGFDHHWFSYGLHAF